MTKGFPTYSSSAKKGDAGINLVSRTVFETFQWIFKRNHQEYDFGIDGHIEVVTSEGSVTGQMLGAQIKYGSSYFTEKNRWGYVYRGELKHFNYLSNYPVPIVVIICNPDTGECLWALFDPTQTTRTPEGWKLTIPFENDFKASKEALSQLLFPADDNLELLEGYWQLNNLIIQAGYIHFIIDKADVDAMDVSRAGRFLDRLKSTKELAFSAQGTVEFSIYGYDDDSRELFEIKEVRKYIQKLEASLPELFFFVRTKQPTSTLRLFMMCLTKVTIAERDKKTKQLRLEYDTDKIGGFIRRQIPGFNQLTDWVGITEDEHERLWFEITDCMGIPRPEEPKPG